MKTPTMSSEEFSKEKKLDQDTLLKSPSGTTFTAPKGWTVRFVNGIWEFQDPDRELVLRLLENQTGEFVDVVEKAWKKIQPGFSREVKEILRFPGRDGWDEAAMSTYKTTTAEKRVVGARGRRKGGAWWFRLIDGNLAAVDRRWAQIELVLTSLKVPGVEPESFAGKKANRLDATRQQALERFTEDARVLSRVPGAAVAIVQDGKVVYEKGFGVREKGGREPVTPLSLFEMGSIGKQFTTLMMARLVDKGVFDWETPVLKLMPSFKLGDEEMTKKLVLRHTVSASTGLPRQDMEFLFQFKGVTPEEALNRLAAMKPTTGFGEVFQYSNSMVMAGGFIAAHAARPSLPIGDAFDQTMQEEVFDPLGMSDTTMDKSAVEKKEHCTPHAMDLPGKVFPIPLEIETEMVRTVRPAGGIWSNLRDMERLLLMETSNGLNPDGGRFVSEKNLLKRREPQVKVNDKTSYGLGLFVEENCGVRVVHHSGGSFGFITHFAFLPEYGVGAVIVTNVCSEQACFFFEQVFRRIMELLFNGKEKAANDLALVVGEWEKKQKADAAKVELKPDKEWLKKLVGDYYNESLGRIVIRLKEDDAVLTTSGWDTKLGRKIEEDGTVKVPFLSPPVADLELILGEENGRPTLMVEMPQQKYVFKQVT
jgi:CubicO group peptidase (beta-lactamase class C family)